MKILVVGNGGREDAICKKISESPKLTELYCTKGNAGTSRYAKNLELETNEEIYKFCKENEINLVVIGPEVYLVDGLVDLFKNTNIKVFGPNKECANLEGSKDFAKKFMVKYNIDTAKYETAYSLEEAKLKVEGFDYPVVVKADGLCAGKGVRICETKEESYKYFEEIFEYKIFGDEGSKVVIEEFLDGEEASLLCFVSNYKLFPMESARDYKKIFENDKGENTGGVGCYSPNELLSSVNLEETLEKISNGLKNEGLDYAGILFIGFMIKNNKAKILEFNVRFGDPETEVILPRMESDLVELIEKSINKTLLIEDLKWKKEKSMTVVLTSKGYPRSYEKGKLITGVENVDKDIYVYHNNTKEIDGKVYSDGGRVLSVTTLGDNFEEMRERVYKNIEKIYFENMSYRKDIAKK